LANTSSTANRVQSVTITDATGVDTGGNAPRVYFNKNAGTYFSTACSLTAGTVQSGTVVSNGFGVYRFGNLQVGQTYTLRVESRTHTFAPMTVSVTGQAVTADMIAEQ